MTSPTRVARRPPAGLLSFCLVLVLSACGGQAGTPTDRVATTASTPSAAPTILADPTPLATIIDGVAVTSVFLGADAAPIDVAAGFGSLWVADHRADAVSRIEPGTLEEIARIQVGGGPGWFAITADAVWVSNQLGRGVSRIDPMSNTADVSARAGQWAPCWAPVVLDGYVWQLACEAGQIMRIDPATGDVRDYTAYESEGIAVAGDELIVVGRDGLSILDREADELVPLSDGCCRPGDEAGADSVWLSDGLELRRVSLGDGSTIATLPLSGELIVLPEGDRAWVTRTGLDVLELDLATNEIVRTLTLDRPTVAREIDGVLWVTSFDASTLSRVEIEPVEP